MRWFCVAAVLLVVAENSHGASDLNDLKSRIQAILNTKETLYEGVTNIKTAQIFAQEAINRLLWLLFPETAEKNRQQNMIIDHLKEKAKNLQHHTQDVAQVLDNAGVLANATMFDMPNLTSGVDSISNENAAMNDDLANLQDNIQNVGDMAQMDIDNAVNPLNSTLHGLVEDFNEILSTAGNQSCVYRSVYLEIPEEKMVRFGPGFKDIPSVSYSIVGFRSHIDEAGSHHGSYSQSSTSIDLLAFNVTVSDVTVNGFNISVSEVDVPGVEPKDVYVRYMACLNIDLD